MGQDRFAHRGALICAVGAFLLLCATPVQSKAGIAIMGLDLGSEHFKVAIVKPGVPMEIALNTESKRKTPTIVAIKGEDTLTGGPAAATALKFPTHSFRDVVGLLGKKFDSTAVKEYKEMFPFAEVSATEEGTVQFKHPDIEQPMAVEQVLALILKSAKSIASNYAETNVRDCVITVPVYMNQFERERLIYVAEKLADLKVLQLINQNAAIALNFGMFRRKEFADGAKNVVIYDMGATKTVATVVEIKIDEKSKDPTATILGVSWDRSLGGLQWDLRVRDFLKKKFEEANPKLSPVTKPRALAKLLKEAQKVRQVLSANAKAQARIENLTGDDVDLRQAISREEIEEMCKDLFARALAPIENAIEMSQLDKATGASEVLLFGGLTRTPLIKTMLTDNGFSLLANINTDEAAAIGASYRAADLSSAFRVKPFAIKNASPVQIQVEFEREITDEDTGEKKIKHSKRILFAPGNVYPQKKVLTFNRYTDDFSFDVNYGNVDDYKHLTNDQEYFQAKKIMTVQVTGVAHALEKHPEAKSKGIKVHFSLDDNGIFHYTKVEHLFEEQQLVEEKKKDDKTADSKDKKTDPEADAIFKTLDMNDFKGMDFNDPESMKLFQDKMKTLNLDEAMKKAKAEKKEGDSEEVPADDEENKPADEAKPAEEAKEGDEKKEEEKPEPKYKTVKRSVTLAGEPKAHTGEMPAKEATEAMAAFLKKLQDAEAEKKAREAALNDIETFIYDKKDKLDLAGEGYAETVGEEEKEKIRTALTEADKWLWDVEEPTSAVYKEKLGELEKISAKWLNRAKEFQERPKILESFEDQFNHTRYLIQHIKKTHAEQPEDDRTFTDKEIETLETKYKEVMDWKNETKATQDSMDLTAEPVLTYAESFKKSEILRREADYVIKRAKSWRPKPKKEEPKKEEKAGDEPAKEGDKADSTSDDKTKESSEKTEEKKSDTHEEL